MEDLTLGFQDLRKLNDDVEAARTLCKHYGIENCSNELVGELVITFPYIFSMIPQAIEVRELKNLESYLFQMDKMDKVHNLTISINKQKFSFSHNFFSDVIEKRTREEVDCFDKMALASIGIEQEDCSCRTPNNGLLYDRTIQELILEISLIIADSPIDAQKGFIENCLLIYLAQKEECQPLTETKTKLRSFVYDYSVYFLTSFGELQENDKYYGGESVFGYWSGDRAEGKAKDIANHVRQYERLLKEKIENISTNKYLEIKDFFGKISPDLD